MGQRLRAFARLIHGDMTGMLSLNTARALRQVGLVWKPAEFDFFAVPDRDLDERVFVISDMPAAVGNIQGTPMFRGTGGNLPPAFCASR